MNHAGGICRWRRADEGELHFCSHTTIITEALENKVCQTTEFLFMRRATLLKLCVRAYKHHLFFGIRTRKFPVQTRFLRHTINKYKPAQKVLSLIEMP